MCGIFGFNSTSKNPPLLKQLKPQINELFILSESRGKEASGITIKTNTQLATFKSCLSASQLIKDKDYNKFSNQLENLHIKAFIGHSRLATHGSQLENINNQPVASHNLICVHNGIIVNHQKLWKSLKNKQAVPKVDTQSLLEQIQWGIDRGLNSEQSVQRVFQLIEGSATICLLNNINDEVIIATNTGSLYFAYSEKLKAYFFTSEFWFMKEFFDKHSKEEKIKIQHVAAQNGVKFEQGKKGCKFFRLKYKTKTKLTKNKIKPNIDIIDYSQNIKVKETEAKRLYTINNDLKKLKRHNFDYKKIHSLKRCTKCILPETTPYIKFDEKGICNYCHQHPKINYKGIQTLKKLVKPYRKNNGEPDCLIAFSGGRDSSYGLHFLKEELGLNPLAYTYDWGMVTDMARRNQARLIGKLGVEHIIVSADITKKRKHINQHINAWIKKPDLGMVPLFMEGDKQCEFYADQIMKKYNIKLMFFCRGNEFEKEEFKTGHCGVKNADPGGVIHNLPLKGKIQMALYYAKQYLSNPAYINSSIFDTLLAYFTTYIQKHDYVFLWHYVPWDEKEILTTLKKKYNWESSDETNGTWRTDDGTSPFYNYIYYTGQGFTENDSFRARQIREGKLTRKKALTLVNEENKPRHKALKWYFDSVGLDGDKILSVIDKMPKLY